MYEKPDLWSGVERIQWACVLMSVLGETSLEHLHLVLSGLRCVEQLNTVAPYKQELRTARLLLRDLLTRNAVQSAVYSFIAEAEQKSYEIDPKTLNFKVIYGEELDASIRRAKAVLRKGLARRRINKQLADTSKDLQIRYEDIQVPIRLNSLSFPEPTRHQIRASTKTGLNVTWSELVDLAELLDEEDRQAQRPLLFWSQRIAQMQLRATSGQGLRDSDQLDLSGLKHLIGLPGSGKTTLITLLCILLQRRAQRVAVFFTSISLARDYLEILRRYGVKTALLMGWSDNTHRRHAQQIAELIAAQGEGGFCRTREGVELFASSCPLPAFAESWPDRWTPAFAPCESLYEVHSKQAKLCPAWSYCGRVKNQRDLVEADVWLGHVISSDTRVPSHTCDEQYRYFELIAANFDLVIFDECDEIQKVLDDFGTLTLEFTGNDESLHIQLQKLIERVAANRTKVSDALVRYMLRANEFERHTLRFVQEIRKLSKNKQAQNIVNKYADVLLSSNFLIREAIESAGNSASFSPQAITALSDFWERAMYHAFFRMAPTTDWIKAEKYAHDLLIDVSDDQKVSCAKSLWRKINAILQQYLQLDHAAEADELIDQITLELQPLFKAKTPESIKFQIRLLVVVGFTIASYQRLAREGRIIAQYGEMPNELVFSRVSEELREYLPRSLLGSFSALRYRRSTIGQGFEIDYLVIDTTPRLLLHRMHEIGRANVLLTSATSWMEPSTEYHIAKKPDYVLASKQPDYGEIRLYLAPKHHPRTRKSLRFSGAGEEREENLRHMISALANHSSGGVSELERAVRAVQTSMGRSRKAALVVNSYEQVRLVIEQLTSINPALAQRSRGVVREIPYNTKQANIYILRSQVEELGSNPDIDVIVFPIASLGRGINIVFQTDDEDNGRAAVGSIYFLTRPHPGAGDLSLMNSLIARETHRFDHRNFSTATLTEVQQAYNRRRYALYRQVANLLARPLSFSRLEQTMVHHFAANLLVPIIQTIGRGMRKRMPIDVYFVDAAWAPRSCEGQPESDRSSVLIAMQRVLEVCCNQSDPDERDIYQALYAPFLTAFREVHGLIPPQSATVASNVLFLPSMLTNEIDFENDDFDSDDFDIDEFNNDESI
jgi:hypothetical protein